MPLFKKLTSKMRRKTEAPPLMDNTPKEQQQDLSLNLAENLAVLTKAFTNSDELKVARYEESQIPYGLAYLISVVDEKELPSLVFPFLRYLNSGEEPNSAQDKWETTTDFTTIITKIIDGYVALFVKEQRLCYLLYAKTLYKRETTQPEGNSCNKGPKDGFVENSLVNLALLRSRLKDPSLRLKKFILGTRTKTDVYVVYLEDLAQPDIVKTVLQRIELVKVDQILNGSDLAQQIEDSSLSPFPQSEYTERPDTVAAALNQGRIAIFIDGSPGTLLAPTTFFDLIDAPDDYHNTWFVSASIIRFVRLLSIIFATFLPSLYIALTAYNPDFIPTSLALMIAGAREGVPFPTPIEAFLIVSIVEISRESILHLPHIPAQVIGIAAISVTILASIVFHLFSTPMIIVILFSIICSSVVPDNDLRIAIRELMFFYMFLASVLGIFGVAMAFFYVTIHAITLKSFGIPYMSPLAPIIPRDWGRIILRLPDWALRRSQGYHAQDSSRQKSAIDREAGELK